ncbi:MAG: 30S ribosomal protein S6 [Chloroflexota bacterium]
MIRSYEIPVVFRVMPDEETQTAIDQVTTWIENSTEGVDEPGSVTRIDRTRFGRRRLAYEIDGQRDGNYIFFYANMKSEHVPDFETNMRLYDGVLRYLVIREDEVAFVEEETSIVEEITATEEPVEEVTEEAEETAESDE